MEFLDGAIGTMLQQRGLPPGGCPEEMNLLQPEAIESVHRDYLKSGADWLTTNTFGGNRIKLSEYHLEDRVAAVNRAAVHIAQMACDKAGRGKVLGSIGPTGLFVEPLGDMSFKDMVAVFYEQATALAEAGADALILETFSDLGEARAALLGCKDACDLPVFCSLTFMGDKTLTGASPEAAAVVLEAMGAAALGCNCSGGPQELVPVIRKMRDVSSLPLFVSPNAGIPVMEEGEVIYPLDAPQFADAMQAFLPVGMQWLGGCCGTTPDHIRALIEKTNLLDSSPFQESDSRSTGYLCARDRVIRVEQDGFPHLIGERINPTARKRLAEAMRQGDWAAIQDEAREQIQHGADLLDINVGADGIDERHAMHEIVALLQRGADMPLVIDNTRPDVLDDALSLYHGKALINSVNGEEASMNAILPLAARYGAAVVALTLDEAGIPETPEGRLAIAERIVKRAADFGIEPKDIYVDTLVMTVGTDTKNPGVTREAMRLIREKLGVHTLLGVSNVSYGLPNRGAINSAFLAVTLADGLDIAIVNPMDRGMMDAFYSTALLADRDPHAGAFLSFNQENSGVAVSPETADTTAYDLESVARFVVEGSSRIEAAVQAVFEAGTPPLDIINHGLIPGLEVVGQYYEDGTYYLPQLMLSAEMAQKAFAFLEKHMNADARADKGTMVIGTVKGDVHDIGKNMVAVMVRNHGYRVIDLGKNVPKEMFVEQVLKENATFLGLSALMTTTMQEIPGIIEAVRAVAPDVRILVGGAVVTESFAKTAGADAYAGDAVATVKTLAQLQKKEA